MFSVLNYFILFRNIFLCLHLSLILYLSLFKAQTSIVCLLVIKKKSSVYFVFMRNCSITYRTFSYKQKDNAQVAHTALGTRLHVEN